MGLWHGCRCHLLMLGCLSLVLILGCDPRETGSTGPKPGHASTTVPSEPPRPKPLFKDWPVPAAALVISGRQHGYLEPCGCSETQSGGVARRADLFHQIQDKAWPVAAFDLGGSIERTRLQSRYKFETILAALSDMKYAAVGLGPEELRLGPEYLLSLNPGLAGDSGSFLAANVVFFDAPELGTPTAWKLVTAGEVKIAVTSVLGEQHRAGVVDTQISTTSPVDALERVIPEMQAAQPDLMLLLCHAAVDESVQIAEKFPQFDIIASAGGPEDPDGRPKQVGDAILVTVGGKGKYVGVVGYYPGQDERFRFELVDLDNRRFKDDPKMTAHMQYYQDRLEQFHDDVFDDLPDSVHPSGSTFVGAEKCGECHKKAFAKWKDSKHAHAFESLIKGREGYAGTWVSRIHDPECLCCHTTGWNSQEVSRFESGFYDENRTPNLLGQQCENCHGPGSKHVDLELAQRQGGGQTEELLAARKSLHLTTEVAKQRVCVQCHDFDNSPKFEFDTYWEKVKHPWRD